MTAEDHLVTAAPTTQAPFQCDRANLWSLTKQRWCCEHRGVGCSSTTTVMVPAATHPVTTFLPYDCNADFRDNYQYLVRKWHVGKRAWCCAHARRGCPPAYSGPVPHTVPVPHAAPGPTSAPVPAPAPTTGRAEQKPPPAAPPLAAPRPAVPQPAAPTLPLFLCDVGLANFAAGWSVAKKQWCCQHEKKGCPPVPHQTTSKYPPVDCSSGFSNWKIAWSEQKKEFCCVHEGKGCRTSR